MITSNLQLYICVALPAVVSWFLVSSYRQYRRLSHIPGPRGTGFTKWWFVRSTLSGRTHLDYYDTCKRYGSIARISPNDVVTSDPELIKRMLAVRSPYTRSDWYNGLRFDPSKNNIVSMRDDALHSIVRTRMAAGYSGKEVENLEMKIDNSVQKLINLIESYVSENRAFDLARKIHYFTIDVISDLAFGDPFGDLVSDSDKHEYIKNIETYLPTLIISTVMSWVIPLLGLPIFRPFMPSEHDVLGIGRVMGLAKKVAAERYGPKKKTQKDMVGSFVARGLTQPQAESEIAAQIVAGSDTTATAIRATILHIITTPRVLAKVRAEIEQSNLTWPIATDAEAKAMPYLQATIKEGLRIFPPVTGFMSKEVPVDGDSWKGVLLPPGTKIGICMWGVCRWREVWGEDADEFRPERWLEATPEHRKEMDATLDILFGTGKWGCLGRNVASIELNKVLVELIRRFDLALLNPTTPWKSINCGIFLQSDFWVRGYNKDAEMVSNRDGVIEFSH